MTRWIWYDYETYWDSENFSLSKMSTDAYVSSDLFAPLLLGVAVDNGPVVVFEQEQISTVLQHLSLGDPNTFVCATNNSFDSFITENYYGISVANGLCTRALMRYTGASRLTGESLSAMCKFFQWGEKGAGTVASDGKHREDFSPDEWTAFKQYCADDVEQLRHHVQTMLATGVPHDALKFIALSERLYTRPVIRLDKPLLEDYRRQLILKQEQDMNRLQSLFQFASREEFLKAIRSRRLTPAAGRQSFPAMLKSLGAEVPMKVSEAREKSVKESKDYLRVRMQSPETISANWPEIRKAAANIGKGFLTPALAKTDLEFMALMDSDDEDVALLCRVRAENNTSQALSRTETLLGIAERGDFPVTLGAYRAHTGRYAGRNAGEGNKSDATNPQNFSKRSGDITHRKALLAAEGCRIVAADSGQIECRVLAWHCNEEAIVSAFREGRDVYSEFGTELFQEPVSKATKKYRDISKTCVLSLGYQAGWKRLAEKLRQDKVDASREGQTHDEFCEGAVNLYRNTYRNIKQGWVANTQVLNEMVGGGQGWFGGPTGDLFRYDGTDTIFGRPAPSIMLPDGYKLRYPNLRWDNEEREFRYDMWNSGLRRMEQRKIYSGLVMNNIIQGLSAAIIRWQMLRIDDLYAVHLQVHDEIVCAAVPEKEADQALEFMLEVMSQTPPWLPGGESLPLKAEGGHGKTYGDV